MNELIPTLTSLLKSILAGICYHPSDVVILIANRGPSVSFYVTVNADDIGIVCGKDGRNIKALQFLFKTIGKRADKDVGVYVEKKGERTGQAPEYRVQESWNKTYEALEIVGTLLNLSGVHPSVVKVEDTEEVTTLFAQGHVPDQIVQAIDAVIHGWGKSQGRKIVFYKADQVNKA